MGCLLLGRQHGECEEAAGNRRGFRPPSSVVKAAQANGVPAAAQGTRGLEEGDREQTGRLTLSSIHL